MGSVNRATIVGNLGADAELRHTPSGKAVANFRVATTDRWRDKASGEAREQTEWHRIVLWGDVAERLAPYLTKGRQVYVEGRIATSKYTDKEGVERTSTSIVGDKVVLLGGGQSSGTSRQDAHAPAPDEDIPF